MLKKYKSSYSIFNHASQKTHFLTHELPVLQKSVQRNQLTICKVILAKSEKPPATTDSLKEVYPELRRYSKISCPIVLKQNRSFTKSETLQKEIEIVRPKQTSKQHRPVSQNKASLKPLPIRKSMTKEALELVAEEISNTAAPLKELQSRRKDLSIEDHISLKVKIE